LAQKLLRDGARAASLGLSEQVAANAGRRVAEFVGIVDVFGVGC